MWVEQKKLEECFAEDKHSNHASNEHYIMAKHYTQQPFVLKDAVCWNYKKNKIKKKSMHTVCVKSLLQGETFWIWKLEVMEHPGLNEEIIDLSCDSGSFFLCVRLGGWVVLSVFHVQNQFECLANGTVSVDEV